MDRTQSSYKGIVDTMGFDRVIALEGEILTRVPMRSTSPPPQGHQSTMTFEPIEMCPYKSMMSWFIIRIHPDDTACPID
jgi:hypothetical protein